MKRIESECIGCKDIGLFCMGDNCPYKIVVRFYCDRCDEEATLYDYYGEELCKDCILEKFNVIEGSDILDW